MSAPTTSQAGVLEGSLITPTGAGYHAILTFTTAPDYYYTYSTTTENKNKCDYNA